MIHIIDKWTHLCGQKQEQQSAWGSFRCIFVLVPISNWLRWNAGWSNAHGTYEIRSSGDRTACCETNASAIFLRWSVISGISLSSFYWSGSSVTLLPQIWQRLVWQQYFSQFCYLGPIHRLLYGGSSDLQHLCTWHGRRSHDHKPVQTSQTSLRKMKLLSWYGCTWRLLL